MKRLAAAILLVSGLTWPIAGCGGNSIVSGVSSVGSGLVLADSVTQAHFSVSVVNGAPTLTGLGSSGAVSVNAGLIDHVTGAHYLLAVTSGALTLVPGSTATEGAAQIGLVDSVTAKTYTLVVVNGALTLTQA
ncbi:MAG TPA: hypothetical protein VF865_00430 [Acidobacteriaceae bacterium]